MPLGASPPYLCLWRRNFCAAGGRSSFVTAVRFLNGQEAFPLTTAAQNIPVFLRKSTLHKKHFFAWLKTENFSTACGTVTLKSPPSWGSDASHVHPRPRKRPPRCTLDCGFKTSESPALRGFVGGLRALATAALYLVIFSNGLRRPKIWLKKFDFSPKPIPANIAKKLPPQRCSKPFLILPFNLSHKRPTFAFTAKVRTHSALPTGSHTRAHTAKQVAFWVGVVSLPSERSARSQTSPGRVSERQTLPLLGLGREVLSKNAESLRDSDALMRVAVPQAPRPRWAA